ncbi:MAG: DUF1624 domain-containing protein [Clostridiales bacterium]|nr:DUF1624 domain-containing protein [Clostridiales bacterium]
MMQRYETLDELRGLVFISMVLYHGMWDVVYLFGYSVPWYTSDLGYIWQQSICCTFILLSGFCWSLGRKKWKRAMQVFGAGALVSFVTILFTPDSMVIFGVLTFLGTAAILLNLLAPLLKRCPPLVGLIASLILFVITKNVNGGYLGFEEWRLLKIPEGCYQNLFTTFWGFQGPYFYSSDYFSVIPWIFLYLTGYFLFRCLREVDRFKQLDAFPKLEKGKVKPLRWLGQHSLLLYLLHQPVILVVLMIFLR